MYIIFFLILILLILIIYVLNLCKGAVKNVKRLDTDGGIYYGEYAKDYRKVFFHNLFKLMRGSSCTAFIARDLNGLYLTGRNYDMPHKDKKGNVTGLNMVLRIKGIAKYDSINGVDASWLSFLKFPYYKGAIDNPKVSKLPMAILPYLAMDGINSEGLSVSILALDLKEGEHPVKQDEKGKKKITINELVRLMLDNCKDKDEAIVLANEYNMVNLLNYDYHLFISDATGKSIVMEWRFNKLHITKTNLVTNFYVSYDDAEDCYYGSDLKEKYDSSKNVPGYRYGYGHGYDRFNIAAGDINSISSTDDALNVLSKVSQDYTGMLTSYTQYSVVYNNTRRTATFCNQKDYENRYTFNLS